MSFSIAIDGPAGAGKSTISRKIADRLGFLYLDTGALYRAIAFFIFRENYLDYENYIDEILAKITLVVRHIDGIQQIFLNNVNITEDIRKGNIGLFASKISSIKEVREFLLFLQRDIAKKNNVILDGRDIGTVVLPNANVKIFLTASIEVRAKRRFLELTKNGEDINYDKVLDEVRQRDINDTQRLISPLIPAADSIMFDTSDLDVEESVELIYNLIYKDIGV